MKIKQFAGDLVLEINGDRDWAFDANIRFSYHATNFSKIIINNVIHKTLLDEGTHFLDNNINNIDTFSIATLYSNGKEIFTGIVNSSGRYSLSPWSIKDKSLEIVDPRLWLSKRSPADISFENDSPFRALHKYIRALDEAKIKVGSVSFSNLDPITAYDTTSKSPYSVLKDVIASRTRSFLYFSQDNGNLLINYKSDADFQKGASVVEITPETWKNLKITDLQMDENIDNYFNTYRLESENVVSTQYNQEYFLLSNSISSVWLVENFSKLPENSTELLNYYYSIDEPLNKKQLNIISKQEKTSGNDYHLYYQDGRNELVINPKWERENLGLVVSYVPVGKYSVTLSNQSEVNRIHNLNNFNGDVYKYERSNDLSSFDDLYTHADNSLKLNSFIRYDMSIQTNQPFLELGDIVSLNLPNAPKFNGRYICIGFDGSIKGKSGFIEITYQLRNGLNSDTLLNFYDNQDYKINPLKRKDGTYYKFKDFYSSYLHSWKRYSVQQSQHQISNSVFKFLPAYLPYNHSAIIDYESIFSDLIYDNGDISSLALEGSE
ncbi:hypothetical protein BCF59_0498 [Mycoplasmopsis mustelae]|uniref:Uncharacterized protein n=1 Tax=Mycoplasmopsis mustelae TaxID=171289 RepID=A0A4V3FNV7_9BACT|nr:hypothetical protein [Mycoplasmopsis mustelae]TDV23509.1 hypothetical protein BCF59_0498 [Mycoplasmopsis mustelae]